MGLAAYLLEPSLVWSLLLKISKFGWARADQSRPQISVHQSFLWNGTDYYTIFDLPISTTNSIPLSPAFSSSAPGSTTASNIATARPGCAALNNPLLSAASLAQSVDAPTVQPWIGGGGVGAGGGSGGAGSAGSTSSEMGSGGAIATATATATATVTVVTTSVVPTSGFGSSGIGQLLNGAAAGRGNGGGGGLWLGMGLVVLGWMGVWIGIGPVGGRVLLDGMG